MIFICRTIPKPHKHGPPWIPMIFICKIIPKLQKLGSQAWIPWIPMIFQPRIIPDYKNMGPSYPVSWRKIDPCTSCRHLLKNVLNMLELIQISFQPVMEPSSHTQILTSIVVGVLTNTGDRQSQSMK